MNTHQKTIGLGIMSGTSLDGIDLALCRFSSDDEMTLIGFESAAYPISWRARLQAAPSMGGLELLRFADEYTRYTAGLVTAFLEKQAVIPDFIGAHGHTIFHQPAHNFTYQMLNGALLSALTACTVVCDFRSKDVGLGGQGAPLVPIGDRLLFGSHAACINIGGFSNISYEGPTGRIAYDLGPANLVLNALAHKRGQEYDDGGHIAASGQIVTELLNALNALPYFQERPPKSLGREWLETVFNPIIASYKRHSIEDLACTLTEHVAIQIANGLTQFGEKQKVLLTGGGAHNTYLVERIRAQSRCQVIIPDQKLVDAKEAIVFALLGKLRLEEKINTLSTVTGASKDSIGGAVHLDQ